MRFLRFLWLPATPALVLLAAVLVGFAAGEGGFTFRYAEGLSYLSTDPKACANCHIMQPQYDSWQKTSHHTVATCVDCHLPHAFLPKYLAKAENGWHHSSGFTLQNFHEPIRISAKNAASLQENCIRCHGELTHPQVSTARSDGNVGIGESFGPSAAVADVIACVHCHAYVGHGEKAGLGGRRTEREP